MIRTLVEGDDPEVAGRGIWALLLVVPGND